MDTRQFDFELPNELIALRPASPRHAARLLVVTSEGYIVHNCVSNLPQFLRENDALVSNDSKVIAARLRGRRLRTTAGREPKIEVLLCSRLDPARYSALCQPARKLQRGDVLAFGQSLHAEVIGRGEAGEVELRFNRTGEALDAAIAAEGEMPLPPYIARRRAADAQDAEDYQTIFARVPGSVAAPTAGLHFTRELLASLKARGVTRESVTLEVGPGTFLPVTASDTSGHKMHAERAVLSAETSARLNAAHASGGRIVAVGTTSLRTLETAASPDGRLEAFDGLTDLFIMPGYRFKTAEILLTNFHLPRSTLFMLVCAFCGIETMKTAYAEAIRERYRFYSYGDACLLFRPRTTTF